jgi:BMFP domain-containing protein YqiC
MTASAPGSVIATTATPKSRYDSRARCRIGPPGPVSSSKRRGRHLRRPVVIAIVRREASPQRSPEPTMTQTTNRFFDEMARLMNDAAGVAQGVRREFDTLFRTQAERILRDLDVVKREEFEAVKEMARLAREENEALKARLSALEAKLGRPG